MIGELLGLVAVGIGAALGVRGLGIHVSRRRKRPQRAEAAALLGCADSGGDLSGEYLGVPATVALTSKFLEMDDVVLVGLGMHPLPVFWQVTRVRGFPSRRSRYETALPLDVLTRVAPVEVLGELARERVPLLQRKEFIRLEITDKHVHLELLASAGVQPALELAVALRREVIDAFGAAEARLAETAAGAPFRDRPAASVAEARTRWAAECAALP